MLQIRLLGQPHCSVEGVPIRVDARPKVLPLLTYLLLHRRQPVSRETLAYTLWPDAAEAEARANLRRHLYWLQRALPPAPPETPWLLVDPERVQWNPAAPCWFDVDAFERAVAADDLPAAADLYGGDLLTGSYDDWLLYERERLCGLYVSVLSRLVEAERGAGSPERALRWAEGLLAHDPLREDALRRVLALRYELGDRAGALNLYRAFVRRLREELGVEPMPETVAVASAILHHARLPGAVPVGPAPASEPLPAPDLPAEAAGPARPGGHLLPLTGRDAELAQLTLWWARAARGRGARC